MDLVDRQTGATVAVPEQDAIPALQSGKFGVMPGQKVPVVKDGQVGTVPAEQLGTALQSGIRLAAPDEVHKATTEFKYGDRLDMPLGMAHPAASIAALRGATAGLSDPALLAGARYFGGQELEGKAREALVGLKEANPWRTLGGEVGGMVAANAALPNASPIGQIGKLGATAEGAVTGARAATLGGRLAQSALSYGVRGAVEGGAIGAGYAASDAALEDKELTGEKLLAGARGGALTGGLLGAGTGAAGELLGAGARKLGEAVSGSLKGESVADALEGFAGKKMFKGAGPLIRDERAAAKFAGGGEEVGRIFNRELETAGKSKIQSAEALGDFATEHAEKLGAELGDMRASLDRLPDAERYQPKVADLIKVAMKEIGEPLSAKPMFEADAQAFGKALESVGVSTGYLKPGGGGIANPEARVSFEGYAQIRKALADKAYRVTGNTPSLNPSPHVDDLRQLKALWEEEFTKSAENAAKGENPTWREGYEALKKRYQATRIISDITKDAELRGNRNNTLGLTDYVLSAGALATGHPVGAVATAFGNKIAKGYGNQILASLASDLAKTKFLQSAGSSVDRSLIDGVRGLLGEGARTAVDTVSAEAGARSASSPPRLGHLPLSAYDREVNDAQSAATNPRAHVLRAAQEFEGIEGHDPELFNALVAKSQRAAEFLASKVPKGTVDARSLTPHLEKPIVSDAEKAEFLTYVRAVRNPMSVIADLKNGSLVPEEVEALRAVYPKIFKRLQEMVGAGLREATKKPSYQATIRLGILFDTPTDATLDPTFVHAVQGTFGPDDESEHPAAGMTPPGMDLQLGAGIAPQSDARLMR